VSLLQLANDLRGAMTYGDAQRVLSTAYTRLVDKRTPEASAMARQVNEFRNKLGAKTVRRAWDIGGNIPGTKSYDEELTDSDKLKMDLLADELDRAMLPGGGDLRPDAKLDIIDRAGPQLGAGLFGLVAAVLLFFLFGRRR
jgi:hypothetical protein